MSGARTAILDRIERALRTARIPSVPLESGFSRTSPTSDPPEGGPHEGPVFVASGFSRTAPTSGPPEGGPRDGPVFVASGFSRTSQGQGDRDPKALLDRFLLEARALGVEAFVEGSVASVRERLAAIVGTRRVLSWNPERLPYDAGAIVAGACLGSAPLREQADAEIGVTGCDAAIAETGSLVLLSAPGAAHTVSLLPPVHVALVRPQDLCFSMGGFFEASAARMADASRCTVVTGPSRTGDIELTLTVGVHGPGRVVVIVGPRDERAAAAETEHTRDQTQSAQRPESSSLASCLRGCICSFGSAA